ncbi:MAG: M18 family aminopeptidase [Clostridia bacterium]|nr:M18 family aminopeptidase [Clostridia bacterium]
MEKLNYELLEFIHSSPTAFHAVNNARIRLVEDGYTELFESDGWLLENGGRYFVRRGDSSLIAFRIPDDDFDGYQIVASHTDSPCFKLKPSFEMTDKGYLRISADKYGGAVLSSWLDRPLSVAGRIFVKENSKIVSRLVDSKDCTALIPSLAPHLKADKDTPLSPSLDMYALLGEAKDDGTLIKQLATSAGVDPESIVSHDLYLVNRQKGYVWGENNSFVSSPRLDDLQCVFASLKGFLLSSDEANVPVFAIFDREEVGSESANGGASTFLPEVLERISFAMGKSRAQHFTLLANTFFISADNAHAVHPNHPEATDPHNKGYLNSGIAIKHNAMGRYVTDAESSAIIKAICKSADLPCFDYTNPTGIQGGSTLGHIMQTQLSVAGADVGLPQLAMHSSYETAGARDTEYAFRFFSAFFGSHIYKIGNCFSIE